jgi:hypothetical protein
MVSCCKHGDGKHFSIKNVNIFNQLSDYQRLNKELLHAVYSYFYVHRRHKYQPGPTSGSF